MLKGRERLIMFPPSKRNFTHLRIYKKNCVLTSDPELSDMAGGGGLCEGGSKKVDISRYFQFQTLPRRESDRVTHKG